MNLQDNYIPAIYTSPITGVMIAVMVKEYIYMSFIGYISSNGVVYADHELTFIE